MIEQAHKQIKALFTLYNLVLDSEPFTQNKDHMIIFNLIIPEKIMFAFPLSMDNFRIILAKWNRKFPLEVVVIQLNIHGRKCTNFHN